jgi:predicted O-methyltransferase YrrM
MNWTPPEHNPPPTGELFSEADFTQPSDFCPHPERWHCQDGESTEWEVSGLLDGLVGALQPSVVVETGTAWGQTTKALAAALALNMRGHLWTLDPDAERIAWSRRYCAEFADWVTFVEAESLTWTPPDVIDLLFADSTLEIRGAELAHFGDWLRPTSLVIVHDTAPHMRSYGRPLQDILERDFGGRFRPVRLHTPRGVTLLEVLR